MRLCACGCGEAVRSPNAIFLQGHHAKIKTKNPPKRDWTGDSCKHCGITLTDETYSNRSKLNDSSDPNRRAWRICKDCLSSQKKLKRDHKQIREYSRRWKYFNWRKTLLNSARRRARDSGVIFDLEENDLNEMLRKQKNKCYWYGVELSWNDTKKFPSNYSLDRLDPKENYTAQNCILCCYAANIGREDCKKNEWRIREKIKSALKNV